MKRLFLAAAIAGVLAILAGRALSRPVQAGAGGSFDAQASQIVAELAAGQFGDVRAQFDPTMLGALSEDGLANAWASFQQLLGDFQSAGQPASVMRGDLTVEQVPVQLAQGAGEVRITFHPDGTIAGLYFLRPGVPVP